MAGTSPAMTISLKSITQVMNNTPAAPSLLEDLRHLANGPLLADCLCVTARCSHSVKSVTIEQPTAAVVLRGEKLLRAPGIDLHLRAGDVLVGTSPRAFDVLNQPDEHGVYLTLIAPLCQEVMDAARLLWAAPIVTQGDPMAVTHITQLEPELRAWCDALRAQRLDQARLAVTSMLLRLCAQGHTALLAPPPPGFATQVRAIVAAQPAREWRSRDFEDALGLSGATLRRRLSAEKTTLSEVIVEARLAQAMELLYTTRWPIKTIAARVGYRSPASFTRRFAQRYGLDPGDIGNADNGNADN